MSNLADAQRVLEASKMEVRSAETRLENATKSLARRKDQVLRAEGALRLERELSAGPRLAKSLDKVLRLFVDELLAEGYMLNGEQEEARNEALAIFAQLEGESS